MELIMLESRLRGLRGRELVLVVLAEAEVEVEERSRVVSGG